MDANELEHTRTPLLLGVEEAAHQLGLGRSKVYELLLTHELTSLRIGRRRLVPRHALDEFVARCLARDSGT